MGGLFSSDCFVRMLKIWFVNAKWDVMHLNPIDEWIVSGCLLTHEYKKGGKNNEELIQAETMPDTWVHQLNVSSPHFTFRNGIAPQ